MAQRRRRFIPALLVLAAALSAVSFTAVGPKIPVRDAAERLKRLAASVFFIESVTADDLRSRYRAASGSDGRRVPVLIVPGHDEESPGTAFRGYREAELTAALGEKLAEALRADGSLEVMLARGGDGYLPDLARYFEGERASIGAFRERQRLLTRSLMTEGLVEPVTGVIHNWAPGDSANRLYGINRWANELGIPLVLHLHFNDYPGRSARAAGKHSGFSIYVPERQYSNAKASRALAEFLKDELSKALAVSDLPQEREGIVETQELIATGANNSLDAAVALLEYGYIYEPALRESAVREAMLDELAHRTAQALIRFLGGNAPVRLFDTALLPYRFGVESAEGSGPRREILSLQRALIERGHYPPPGKTLRDCPLSGILGSCTRGSLARFQEAEGIVAGGSGTLGPLTRARLNDLFSR